MISGSTTTKRVVPDTGRAQRMGKPQTQRLCLTHVHDGYARRANGWTSASSWRFTAPLKQGFQLVGRYQSGFPLHSSRSASRDNLFDPGGDDFVNKCTESLAYQSISSISLGICLCGFGSICMPSPATGITAFKFAIFIFTCLVAKHAVCKILHVTNPLELIIHGYCPGICPPNS